MENNLNGFRVIIPKTEEELRQYYEIRFEVLRKAWSQTKQSTYDEWEDISLHALMLNEKNEPIATGRLQINSDTEGQIRSMAVINGYRSLGLGTIILKFLEEEAMRKKLSTIILDARIKAVPFYERNGYTVSGPSYVLFDEIQHFRMVKKLE